MIKSMLWVLTGNHKPRTTCKHGTSGTSRVASRCRIRNRARRAGCGSKPLQQTSGSPAADPPVQHRRITESPGAMAAPGPPTASTPQSPRSGGGVRSSAREATIEPPGLTLIADTNNLDRSHMLGRADCEVAEADYAARLEPYADVPPPAAPANPWLAANSTTVAPQADPPRKRRRAIFATSPVPWAPSIMKLPVPDCCMTSSSGCPISAPLARAGSGCSALSGASSSSHGTTA